MVAGDELVPGGRRSDDERDEQAAQRDRLREVVDVRLVEVADVVADEDVVQRETQLAAGRSGADGHDGLLWDAVDPARSGPCVSTSGVLAALTDRRPRRMSRA